MRNSSVQLKGALFILYSMAYCRYVVVFSWTLLSKVDGKVLSDRPVWIATNFGCCAWCECGSGNFSLWSGGERPTTVSVDFYFLVAKIGVCSIFYFDKVQIMKKNLTEIWKFSLGTIKNSKSKLEKLIFYCTIILFLEHCTIFSTSWFVRRTNRPEINIY